MYRTDLSGAWRFETDEKDQGVGEGFFSRRLRGQGFLLPGSACENGVGEKQEDYPELTKEAVRAPRERFSYLGALWLQREFTVPQEMEGRYARLFLERVNMASQLWLDGTRAGRQIVELSAPHIYELGRLTPGTHTLTLRLDNRNLLNCGDMASGYSIDTQGYWNGAVGRIELQYEEPFHAENIQIYPQEQSVLVKLTLMSEIWRPEDRQSARVRLSVNGPDQALCAESCFDCTLYNARQVEQFSLSLESPLLWDEFTPHLYTLNVTSMSLGNTDTKQIRFGMRTFRREGKQFLLNGRQISLRGTIDCAQFPLTGYPSFDIQVWRSHFQTIRDYGLNHVRFHAWCPPECAFDAADELGLYLSVEMPLWINRDVTPLAYGDDPAHDLYYPREARIISKTYGNHPSFLFFSNGNETLGNFELLSDITAQIRPYDPRRLYTLTSNFDHPVMDCEDYLCAQTAGGKPVRIQSLQELVAEGTFVDYREAVDACPVPVISFETGQYCSYPDVDICERYTGNMTPVNFDVIRKHMVKQGIYPRLKEYIAASGDLAAKLYKEEIEAALRTRDLGGFELLSLVDYTGQNTATVGLLNIFYESKGILSPRQFRQFCSSVVPLFRAKRIYQNTEVLEAELELYDFGPEKIKNPVFELSLYRGEELFYQETTCERAVRIPLAEIKEAAMLSVVLSVGAHRNTWRIYVYPDAPSQDAPLRRISAWKELEEISEHGGQAVVDGSLLSQPIPGSFLPVFWSPAWFPTKQPSGEIIRHTHPLFSGFPTDKYPDYQWKELLDHAVCADLSGLTGLQPLVEVVPNFVDSIPSSPLFEFCLGKGRFLFCGFDLDQPDLPTRQLLSCIRQYMASGAFVLSSAFQMSWEAARRLF